MKVRQLSNVELAVRVANAIHFSHPENIKVIRDFETELLQQLNGHKVHPIGWVASIYESLTKFCDWEIQDAFEFCHRCGFTPFLCHIIDFNPTLGLQPGDYWAIAPKDNQATCIGRGSIIDGWAILPTPRKWTPSCRVTYNFTKYPFDTTLIKPVLTEPKAEPEPKAERVNNKKTRFKLF